MANKRGRPKAYAEVKIMQQKIDKYFNDCDMNKEPYTITGLALALNLDRKSINNYAKDSEFFPTIKKAKLRVENYLEKRLINDSSATGIIFNLKNNYGWSDKQQIEHSGNVNNPFSELSIEELRQLINNDK